MNFVAVYQTWITPTEFINNYMDECEPITEPLVHIAKNRFALSMVFVRLQLDTTLQGETRINFVLDEVVA